MGFWGNLAQKLNPIQPSIANEFMDSPTTQKKVMTIGRAYESIEVVNRCINLLVDNSSLVEYDVAGKLEFTGAAPNMQQKRLSTLLNVRPNPYMDISTFRRLLYTDFFIDGNAFIYYDGASLYHVPAANMTIVPDTQGYVHSYEYTTSANGLPQHVYRPNQIIHIKDNSLQNVYRGDSRINSCLQSLYNRESMMDFQKNFFDNGAVMGNIIETDSILSKKLKDKQEREWMIKFNPKSGGGGRPVILDGGMKAKQQGSSNLREMAFNESIQEMEDKVCVALGVPPILLDSGNNANIKPNIELLFYLTIIPMLRKFVSGMEAFFAFDLELTTHKVPALMPDLTEQAERLSALVNNGIITGNEARLDLRREELDDELMKKIRIPANVAGSGTGVTGQQGGKPPSGDKN